MSFTNFKFTPLGGLGQIGANMSLIEDNDEGVIIDSGMLFPRDKNLGISYIMPDISSIDKKKFKKIIITHSHEDHIGALYKLLLSHPSLEVWTPPFASNIINEKFSEFNLRPNIKVYSQNHTFKFKNFEIESFQVNHSTPDSYGLYFKFANDWGLLYCTDFKVNLDEHYEPAFNFQTLKSKMSARKNNIALVDSTNIYNTGKTHSEKDLIPGIEKALDHSQRSIVTLFPSNIHRVMSFLSAAKKLNKHCFFYGRSMHFYLRNAIKSGILSLSPEQIIDIADGNPESDDCVIFVAGCQCDFRSSLNTLVRGHSPYTKIKKGDRVIFSSIKIPGNEQQVQNIQNLITEAGGEVITDKDILIHSSGHPAQEDLKMLYSQLPITHALPIHGESLFLKKHQEFIHQTFPQIKTLLAFNNYQLLSTDSHIQVKECDPVDPILLQRNHQEISKDIISERRKIAEAGIIFVSINQNKKKITLKTKGIPLNEEISEELRNKIKGKASKKKADPEEIRVFTRKFLEGYLGYRPIAIVEMGL